MRISVSIKISGFFWINFIEPKKIGMCLPCHFLVNYASLKHDCAWAIVVEVVPHPKGKSPSVR